MTAPGGSFGRWQNSATTSPMIVTTGMSTRLRRALDPTPICRNHLPPPVRRPARVDLPRRIDIRDGSMRWASVRECH